MSLARGGRLRRGGARHDRHAPAPTRRRASAGALQGRRRRPLADLLLQRGGGRGRGRPRDRLAVGPQALDRARHRPLAQPHAGARAGRGQRLHGPRRGDDGGVGVPQAATFEVERAGPQVPVDARVQEPDDPRHARGRGPRSWRVRTPTARSAPRRSARDRCCRSCPAVANAVLRRGRRARRRGPDHAGQGAGGAGRQGQGRPGALRAEARSPRSTGRRRCRSRPRGRAATARRPTIPTASARPSWTRWRRS